MKIFGILFLLLVVSSAFAHEGAEENTIDETIRENSLFYMYIAVSIVAFVVIWALHAEKQPKYTNRKKQLLFLGIVIPVVFVTVYLVVATIFLNSISETGGPVHWHADYEIWACGNKIEMKEPEGLSNKMGTEVFHHHGDARIHIEGVVVEKDDVSLHHFFEVAGDELAHDKLIVHTNEYVATFKNGDSCNGHTGILQAFLYKTVDGRVVQEKLVDFENYVLAPQANIPPGDCIILEFDQEKEKTNHMCETYKIAIKKGAVSYGS
jgi:hypothetical protein